MLVTIDARQCGAELHGVGRRADLWNAWWWDSTP